MDGAPTHIVVVTGTRAEAGLLAPVMLAIGAHAALRLSVVVTGTHLTTGTSKHIGFPIAVKVPMQRRGEVGRSADVAALGRGVTGLGRAFDALQPDVVLVLGDRIEALAAALAGGVGGFRVAHLHGGDRAEGVADEAMRHAITKLAHLHFPATAGSAERILRMGERREHIWHVGSPAIDGLDAIEPDPAGPDAVVLQHPVGDDDDTERRRMGVTLEATAHLGRVVLLPNGDPGSAGASRAITDAGVVPRLSVPRPTFIGWLKRARVIVGNSSAGLIEAGACRCACVNLGPRQAGRERPAHVFDAPHEPAAIAAALDAALAFDWRGYTHPYGDGRAGERIAQTLATLALQTVPLRKHNTY